MTRSLATVRRVAAFGLALACLAAPAARAEDEIYRIDGEVWDDFQGYLKKIGHGNRPGAFAISVDGAYAYWVTCPATQCIGGTTYSHDAIKGCEQESGADCVVFAVRDEIRVQYEITPVGGSQ